MLVLMRKKGQKIMIGDAIEITVTDIGRGQVRLGIIAPKSMPVDRAEVRMRKDDERRNNEYDTIPE